MARWARCIGGWADRLRLLLAQQEALIDFPDEDLPPGGRGAGRWRTGGAASARWRRIWTTAGAASGCARAWCSPITGRPNVGKSSLVNALAERDVAIVSAIPGTTRDALETRVVLGGVPVTLVDTAGLRDAADEIEAEGVRRARARAAAADLVIVVEESTQGGEVGW